MKNKYDRKFAKLNYDYEGYSGLSYCWNCFTYWHECVCIRSYYNQNLNNHHRGKMTCNRKLRLFNWDFRSSHSTKNGRRGHFKHYREYKSWKYNRKFQSKLRSLRDYGNKVSRQKLKSHTMLYQETDTVKEQIMKEHEQLCNRYRFFIQRYNSLSDRYIAELSDLFDQIKQLEKLL